MHFEPKRELISGQGQCFWPAIIAEPIAIHNCIETPNKRGAPRCPAPLPLIAFNPDIQFNPDSV